MVLLLIYLVQNFYHSKNSNHNEKWGRADEKVMFNVLTYRIDDDDSLNHFTQAFNTLEEAINSGTLITFRDF